MLAIKPSLMPALALVLLSCLAITAQAVDGRLDYRDTRQRSGSGDTEYDLQITRREGLGNQRVPLGDRLALLLDFRYLDERSRSEIDGQDSSWRTLIRSGGLALHYHDEYLRVNLEGNGLLRDNRSGGGALARYQRQQLGAWANLDATRWLEAQGRWNETWSRRGEQLDDTPRLRESAQSLNTKTPLPGLGTLSYRFSRMERDDTEQDLLDVNVNHGVRYSGSFALADRRFQLDLSARSRWFEQRSTFGGEAGHESLVLPFGAAYRIDASPEYHDPLEDESLAAPALHDRDRDTPTEIDLGDDAPPGWQVGGDYRNIHYDLGENTLLASATLYLADRALTPELLNWRFYVSDDPEGRVWTELPGGAATADYREWSDQRWGWAVSFHDSVKTRRFKMVNEKLGPVAPRLRVTELEVNTPVSAVPDREFKATNDSQRFDSTLQYALLPGLGFRYNLGLRHRRYGSGGSDLAEDIHGLSLNWRRDRWRASARYEIHHLYRGGSLKTDVRSATLSAGHNWEGGHSLSAYAGQVIDDSQGQPRATNSLSLGGTWLPAPDLRYDQKVSYGWLDDYWQDLSSRSFTSHSSIRSMPTRWLFANLTRVDRWVQREAGIGFSRFNDTTLGVGWTPAPLLTFQSNLVYQVRTRSELLSRHSVNWSPYQGGKVAVRLHASMVSDTRVDSDQRSAGADVSWELRPRLLLESGLEAQSYRREGERLLPLNFYMRGSFRF